MVGSRWVKPPHLPAPPCAEERVLPPRDRMCHPLHSIRIWYESPNLAEVTYAGKPDSVRANAWMRFLGGVARSVLQSSCAGQSAGDAVRPGWCDRGRDRCPSRGGRAGGRRRSQVAGRLRRDRSRSVRSDRRRGSWPAFLGRDRWVGHLEVGREDAAAVGDDRQVVSLRHGGDFFASVMPPTQPRSGCKISRLFSGDQFAEPVAGVFVLAGGKALPWDRRL